MTPDSPTTLVAAQTITDDLIALRHELHAIPEIGLHLPLTQARVLQALAGLDLEVSTGEGLSSVVAVIRGTAPHAGEGRPVVLLRGDMDGLPVTEAVDVPYTSTHHGQMHACGHDLHVTALVGAARVLTGMRDQLAGDVVLMFQPGEEGPGGAEPMIAEGVLEAAGRRVDAAFALHVAAAEYPRGQWFSRRSAMMAGADTITVQVHGRGGHGSQPATALDPVPVLCEIVLALQTMLTRSFDAFEPVVLTVGRISAGTKDNIIPDTAELAATLRTFSLETRETVHSTIARVADGVAAAHGMTASTTSSENYPPTINDDTEYDLAVEVIHDLFGAERYSEREYPEMGAEDFSYVMNEVPGAYVFIGACPQEDYEHAPDNHSTRAAFDDSVLPDAVAWLAEVAVRRLSAARPARPA